MLRPASVGDGQASGRQPLLVGREYVILTRSQRVLSRLTDDLWVEQRGRRYLDLAALARREADCRRGQRLLAFLAQLDGRALPRA